MDTLRKQQEELRAFDEKLRHDTDHKFGDLLAEVATACEKKKGDEAMNTLDRLGSSEKQWLERNRFYPELDESRLKSIFYFTLIWNLFERECCEQNAQIKTHPKHIAKTFHLSLDSEMVREVFDHFQARYIRNGKQTKTFKGFVFKNTTIKNEASDILLKESPSPKEQALVLLYIAFRLRNNLYHGTKNVSKLYEQNENFHQTNRLLMDLIDLKRKQPVVRQ